MRIVGDDAQVYTFGRSLQIIRSLACRIRHADVEFGDRVALIGENHPSWALAYLSIIYRGAVCVPLDPQGEIETLTNFIENSEAKLAFIDTERVDKFRQIEERIGRSIPAVIWETNGKVEKPASAGASPGTNGFHRFPDWANSTISDAAGDEIPSAKGDDIALLIYTSGTTGTPKGVPLTHGNIVSELDGINEVLKLTDKETVLSLLPLFHAYLQIVNLWVATTYGCQVGYLKELSPAELASAMKEFKPTILTTVPRLWYLFHKKIFDTVESKPKPVRALFRSMLAANRVSRKALGINLGRIFFGKVHDSFGGNLRMAVTAGSRFDSDVADDFHDLGFTILQGYGLTETSGAATATYENDNRVGSVGKPLKGAELKIAEPDADGVGEVLIKGPMVFGGYYKNPAATKEAFTDDGWFRSGDLGRFDKDGHLYIVGRAKDVIVLPSGKNVHPEDLEVHYLKCPLVAELAVIGVADTSESKAGAEKLAAVIVPDFEYLKQAKIANSKEAIRHALDNLGRELPEYQRVRDYMFRAEPLPRTATRKIKRFQLKKEIESGLARSEAVEKRDWQLTAEDIAMLESAAGRAVVEVIRQNGKEIDDVHPSMNLEIDLGLDSLARAESIAALEMRFGGEFTGDDAASALTVRDVITLVNAHGVQNGTDADTLTTTDTWAAVVRNADENMPDVQPILRDRPLFGTFAFVVMKGFNLFCRIFLRLDVKGIENLAAAGQDSEGPRPFLVCPNHQSFLDPFILCSAYPYRIFRNFFHVGASEFFESGFMRWVAKMLNVVPIDPDTQLMRAMRAGAAGLKRGRILNIYPEGERAFDGELHTFKKGAAILAVELDLPIVPVALDGVHKVWARRSRKIRLAQVKIRIGKPIHPREIIGNESAPRSDADYERVTRHLRSTIAEMIREMRA